LLLLGLLFQLILGTLAILRFLSILCYGDLAALECLVATLAGVGGDRSLVL
jgi:hypothetical protein